MKAITKKRDLARAFNVSVETVRRWTLKRDFPPPPWTESGVRAWLNSRATRVLMRGDQPSNEADLSRFLDVGRAIVDQLFDKEAPFNTLTKQLPREHVSFMRMDILTFLFDKLSDAFGDTTNVVRCRLIEEFELTKDEAAYQKLYPKLGQKFD